MVNRARKAVGTLSIVPIVLALAACGSSADSGSDDESWKVGIPLDLTEDLSVYAPTFENGFKLAAEEINKTAPPAGKKLELVVADTGDSDSGAVTVYQKLIRRDEVVAILGPITSSQGFAADPIADKAGVPVIAAANTADGIPEIGDCVFRVGAGEQQIIPTAVEDAEAALGFTSAAVVYDVSDDYNSTAGEAMSASLEDADVDVTGTTKVSSGQVDFRSLLTPLLSDEPEVLAVAASAADAIQIVRQARELGFEGVVLGNKGFSGESVTGELGKDAGTIIIGAQFVVGADTPKGSEFSSEYKERYDEDPDEFAALAYDATYMLKAALDQAGADAEPRDVCEALQEVNTLDGAAGKLKFTSEGDVEVPGIALISKNGGPFKALSQ